MLHVTKQQKVVRPAKLQYHPGRNVTHLHFVIAEGLHDFQIDLLALCIKQKSLCDTFVLGYIFCMVLGMYKWMHVSTRT